jgi:predicted dehydrogenase
VIGVPDRLRWGILGTAGIARKVFLPALAEAGGVAAAVASRDGDRAARWAAEHGVDRPVSGYQRLIDDPTIDAVYVPLPNSLHAEWTIRALRAGKPVLCEKPLAGSLPETEQVLAVATETGTLLWEAFVFPFHDQMARIRALLAEGAIGELQEIQSGFHFLINDRVPNIRMSADLAGGALNDVGCYPVQLARHLFATEPHAAWASAVWDASGVDVATWGYLDFPGGRRLLLSCGFRRTFDTFSRLLGAAGRIDITNPFHPEAGDRFVVHASGQDPVTHPGAGADQHSFTAAIRHIQAAVAGREEPRWLAVETSLGTARALEGLTDSARTRPGRKPG